MTDADVTIGRLHYGDAVFVARRLRRADQTEIEPMFPPGDFTPENLAAASCGQELAYLAAYQQKAVACFGATPLGPTRWTAWCYATDDWSHVWRSVTKFMLTVLRPDMVERGATRIEAHTHQDHHQAHAWLRLLGGRHEATLENFGGEGINYYVFSEVINNVLQPVLFPQASTATRADGGDRAAGAR